MRFIHRLTVPYVLASTFVLALLLSLYSIAIALGSEATTRVVEGIHIVDDNRDASDDFSDSRSPLTESTYGLSENHQPGGPPDATR